MDDPVTTGELMRRVMSLETNALHKDVYRVDRDHLQEAIQEVKDSQTWLLRLFAAQFILLLAGAAFLALR